MSYISIGYFAFILISVIFYYLLPKKIRPFVLLISNLVFYYFSGIDNLIYLVLFVILTYGFSFAAKKKTVMWLYVVISAGALVFIKFSGYIFEALKAQFSFSGIIAPLGLSFFTLEGISYVVDIYKGKAEADKNPLNVALYLTYFPTVVEGPISRYSQLAQQLKTPHSFDYVKMKNGLQIVLFGAFKKLVVANRAAVLADEIFTNYGKYHGMVIVFGALVYALQLYADFSGCVDLCRGVSKLYGIDLIDNFNFPYSALSVKEFWGRWHISLSSWLKDYVYIPLGGNRRGKFRKYVNLLVTFTVSGLWHGVGFRYLLWGILHGFYQIVGDATGKIRAKTYARIGIDEQSEVAVVIKKLTTFCLVSYAWIFFRAVSARAAVRMTLSLFAPDFFCKNDLAHIIFMNTENAVVLAVAFVVFLLVNNLRTRCSISCEIAKLGLPVRWCIYLGAVFAVIIFGLYGSGYSASEFLYMQY